MKILVHQLQRLIGDMESISQVATFFDHDFVPGYQYVAVLGLYTNLCVRAIHSYVATVMSFYVVFGMAMKYQWGDTGAWLV